MSSIPSFETYSGVPEYIVTHKSEHPPVAFPSLNNTVSIALCLDEAPHFFNTPETTSVSSPTTPAPQIPIEGEFFVVPKGFVPLLMVDTLTSVVEYNFPPENIPLTQPTFANPIYPATQIAPFIPSRQVPQPSPNPTATQAKPAKAKKTPRPTNAFILFRRENHGRIFQQNPYLSNNDVSKTLGKEWKALPESEKEIYRQKAKSLQQEHQEKYPDYKFTPQPNRRKRTKPDTASDTYDGSGHASYVESAEPKATHTLHNPFHIFYIPKVANSS